VAPDGDRGYDAGMSKLPSEIILLVEQAPEGGFVARALDHSIFTEADDLEALRNAVRDALRCHFDHADRRKVIRLHFVGQKLSLGGRRFLLSLACIENFFDSRLVIAFLLKKFEPCLSI
jgi:hypothetical protein